MVDLDEKRETCTAMSFAVRLYSVIGQVLRIWIVVDAVLKSREIDLSTAKHKLETIIDEAFLLLENYAPGCSTRTRTGNVGMIPSRSKGNG